MPGETIGTAEHGRRRRFDRIRMAMCVMVLGWRTDHWEHQRRWRRSFWSSHSIVLRWAQEWPTDYELNSSLRPQRAAVSNRRAYLVMNNS